MRWHLETGQRAVPVNSVMANYGYSSGQPEDTWYANAQDPNTAASSQSYPYPVSQYHPLSPASVCEGSSGKKRRVNGMMLNNNGYMQARTSDPSLYAGQLPPSLKPNLTPPNSSYDSYLPPTPHSSVGHIQVPHSAHDPFQQHSAAIPVPKTPLKTPVQSNPYSEFTPKTPTTYAKPVFAQPAYPHLYIPVVQPLPQTQPVHVQVPKPAAQIRVPRAPKVADASKPSSSKKRQLWKPREIVLPQIADNGPKYAGDDEHGHYTYQIGELFAGRYTIMKLLGQGTYGKVFQVWDNRQREYCALKVIKAIPKYREASKIELRVLAMLNRCDPESNYNCVKMRGCFDFRNHVCIVTNLHDVSIYDFLKSNKFVPFPGSQVVSFARQIFKSVAYVHSLGLVHTDLKPENMLLTSSESIQGKYKRPRARAPDSRLELVNTDITLIDFGSSVFHDEYHSSVVSTRHYRAPEVVLGLEWSYPCDLWSIACLLVELCTGRVLFETRDNLEHLHMMQKAVCRNFSPKQLADAEFANFPASQQLIEWSSGEPALAPLVEEASISKLENCKTIPQFLRKYLTLSHDKAFWSEFLDLISQLMELNPEKRLTAEEALNHPWLCH